MTSEPGQPPALHVCVCALCKECDLRGHSRGRHWRAVERGGPGGEKHLHTFSKGT